MLISTVLSCLLMVDFLRRGLPRVETKQHHHPCRRKYVQGCVFFENQWVNIEAHFQVCFNPPTLHLGMVGTKKNITILARESVLSLFISF